MPLVPVVPAKNRRHLHRGLKGNDVKAYGRLLKRTLRRLGLPSINAQNGVFGDGLLVDTLLLQRHLKLRADGWVGVATWQAVDPQMHAWERVLLALPKPPSATFAQKMAAQMRAMLVLGLDWYTQRRPGARTLAAWKHGADCSDSALLARALALGVAYDGYGNTAYIWENFAHVDPSDVRLGDFILYGYGSTDHVNVVSDVGKRLCIGFGFAPGGEYGWDNHHSPIMGFRRGG